MIALMKILSWLKHYWYVPVIIIGILVFMFISRQQTLRLINIFDRTRKNHIDEVLKLDRAREEKKKRDMEIELQYKKTLEEIQKKYDEEKKQLSSREKKEIKKIVEESNGNQSKLTNKLANKFNFKVVEK